MRKLAYVCTVDEIVPIENADSIELAKVGGWQTVVRKNEFAVGEKAVYCEIDSWIPTELAPFLSKDNPPREYNGVKGEKLRTIRLRGCLSQGLLLKYSGDLLAGTSVAEQFGIQKWEPSFPAVLSGEAKGLYPSEVAKTDQERCQNLTTEITAAHKNGRVFTVEEKLEGTSCTFYLDLEGEFHVCSRNLSLRKSDSNSYWVSATKHDVEAKMRRHVLLGCAIQGELVGPGIQNNVYGLPAVKFYAFDIYKVKSGKYMTPTDRVELLGTLDIPQVPVFISHTKLPTSDVAKLLELADGPSKLNPKALREGLVWKDVTGGMTFKTVSNKYLMKHKE